MIMRAGLIICALISLSTLVQAEEIIVAPQGEYAEIDTQSDILERMCDPEQPEADKANLLEEIAANMGAYNPCVLTMLAEAQLFDGEVELAAQTLNRAIFRSVVDIRMSQDPTLEDVPFIFALRIGEILEEENVSLEHFADAYRKSVQDLEAWDRSTPRLYDRRWASLHSMGAFSNQPLNYLPVSELDAILEEEYAKLQTND
jgi:DNA-binding transcriptional regulator YiaG